MSDLDHERQVLGAILTDQAALSAVRPILRGEDFCDGRHGQIFDAALRVADAGNAAVDALTVADELGGAGDVHVTLQELAIGCVTADNAVWNAERVAEGARRRAARHIGSKLAESGDTSAALSAIEELGRAIQSGDASTWAPADLDDVLDGTWTQVEPTVGGRIDSVGLFYPGKCHTISSESEGGKTWFALAAAKLEIECGQHVVYIDFEDDKGPVIGRLLAMGAKPDDIRPRFHYVRPLEPIGAAGNGALLAELFERHTPTLAILDGVTEAMTLHGLNPLDNADCAAFGRLLPRRLANMGAAVASLDHLTKSSEGRGRYAIGAVHKLNALDGAAYLLENRTAFGVGLKGRSTVMLAKDRPGQLRKHALPRGQLHWFADLVLDATDPDPGCLLVDVLAPDAAEAATAKPTVLMSRVAAKLDEHPEGLSQRVLCDVVKGKAITIRAALSHLVDDGFVSDKTPHRLLKPYVEGGSDD